MSRGRGRGRGRAGRRAPRGRGGRAAGQDTAAKGSDDEEELQSEMELQHALQPTDGAERASDDHGNGVAHGGHVGGRNIFVPQSTYDHVATFDADEDDDVGPGQLWLQQEAAAILRPLRCAVCLGIVDHAVTTPCMHRFCQVSWPLEGQRGVDPLFALLDVFVLPLVCFSAPSPPSMP